MPETRIIQLYNNDNTFYKEVIIELEANKPLPDVVVYDNNFYKLSVERYNLYIKTTGVIAKDK